MKVGRRLPGPGGDPIRGRHGEPARRTRRNADPPRPPAPQRALHAGRQCARAGEGAGAPGRCAHHGISRTACCPTPRWRRAAGFWVSWPRAATARGRSWCGSTGPARRGSRTTSPPWRRAAPMRSCSPKVEDPATVAQAAATLEAAGAPSEMGIWCMLETPERHPRRAPHRGRPSPDGGAHAGYGRSFEGAPVRSPRARPAALAHQHRALPARRAGGRARGAGRAPFRPVGRRGLRTRLPAGKELRIRRQIAAAPEDTSPSPTPCSAHRRPISHGPAASRRHGARLPRREKA